MIAIKEKLSAVGRLTRFWKLAVLTLLLVLGALLVAFSYTTPGVASRVYSGGIPSEVDLSRVPGDVAQDATRLGEELFGNYGENYDEFVTQLLATYVEAREADVIVFFNAGGWGWNLVEASPGWRSIFHGIEDELDQMGYTSLLLDYQRTELSARGIIDELVELLRVYPSKAEALSSRVEFLTRHIPEARVIVTGESDGIVIADKVMRQLRHNQQVYSIQTGPPFWYRNASRDRTLVLDDNGLHPDTFTRGEIGAMLWASIQELAGVPQAPEDSGRVLTFLRAPGHDYRWMYPEVRSQISEFLRANFDPVYR